MTGEIISKAVGDIGNKYIEEAADFKAENKKSVWIKFCAAAACLCLIAVGASIVFQQDFYDPENSYVAGGDVGLYSVAVLPETENIEDVASAEVVSLTESEVMNNALAKYLPDTLPEGFNYERGSIYNTVMKDGTRYNMLRVEYIIGAVSEQQFAEDGGAIAPEVDTVSELFTVCVMNYKPEINVYDYNEITQSVIEEKGVVYIPSGDCYVGIILETAKPETGLEVLKNIAKSQ